MASAEREHITGVWGQSPQRGPGAEPLVRGSGAKSPWSWQHFSVWTLEESDKFASLSLFCNVSTLHHGGLVGLFYAFITSFTKFKVYFHLFYISYLIFFALCIVFSAFLPLYGVAQLPVFWWCAGELVVDLHIVSSAGFLDELDSFSLLVFGLVPCADSILAFVLQVYLTRPIQWLLSL